MKNKRIIKILIFVIIVLLISINRSYAAIEIKDTTEAVFTNKTISEFYVMAEEMKNPGQGLEGSNVDVKMANNYEWAIVSYFSNSIYGTAGAGKDKGVQLTGSTHLSTNGNITGVMDWGKTKSFTAGIIAKYNDEGVTLTTAGGQAIINAAKNPATTNRIDKFADTGSNNNDISIAKVLWYDDLVNFSSNDEPTDPYSMRSGLFSFLGGGWYDYRFTSHSDRSTNGAASSNITFRPVFYAQ